MLHRGGERSRIAFMSSSNSFAAATAAAEDASSAKKVAAPSYLAAPREQVDQVAAAFAEHFDAPNERHDTLFRAATDAAKEQEPILRDAVISISDRLADADQELNEKCAATFSKLPRYISLLQKITSNLGVLASNAKKVKELAGEVAQECGVQTTVASAAAPAAAAAAKK
jgi:hypothetical protein